MIESLYEFVVCNATQVGVVEDELVEPQNGGLVGNYRSEAFGKKVQVKNMSLKETLPRKLEKKLITLLLPSETGSITQFSQQWIVWLNRGLK